MGSASFAPDSVAPGMMKASDWLLLICVHGSFLEIGFQASLCVT
jgi:hypothetical protein